MIGKTSVAKIMKSFYKTIDKLDNLVLECVAQEALIDEDIKGLKDTKETINIEQLAAMKVSNNLKKILED